METSVVAGVEHHEVRLRVEALEVLKVDDDEPSVLFCLLVCSFPFFRSHVLGLPPVLEELRRYVEICAKGVDEPLCIGVGILVTHSGLLPLGNLLGKDVVWTRIPPPAVTVLVHVVLRGFLGRKLGDVLLVDRAVLIEEDGVHLRPLKLVEQAVLHIVLVAEIQLLEVAG